MAALADVPRGLATACGREVELAAHVPDLVVGEDEAEDESRLRTWPTILPVVFPECTLPPLFGGPLLATPRPPPS